MLAPPISSTPEPGSRPSLTTDATPRADVRTRSSFRDEVARTRERGATRSRPEVRDADRREVEGRDARVEHDDHEEREQDASVRERPESDAQAAETERSTAAESSTPGEEPSVEPKPTGSKSEHAAQPAATKSPASDPTAPAFFLGWMLQQDVALAPTATGAAQASDAALGTDAGTTPALAASNPTPAAPAGVVLAPAPAAVATTSATADVAAVAEVARNASAPDAPVVQQVDVRGAPVGAGAGLVDEAPRTEAPAAARLTPADVPGFLEQLEVTIDAPQKSAVVELEPLDLGRLSVELSIEPGNGVRADVRAERQEGFAALDARLNELRSALVERGFASVNVQLSLGFTEQRSRQSPARSPSGTPAVAGPRTLTGAEVRALAPARDGAIDVWA